MSCFCDWCCQLGLFIERSCFLNLTVGPEWLSGRKARVRGGGLTVTELLKAAALGRVQTLARPGEPIRYLASDIDRLAQQRTTDKGDPRQMQNCQSGAPTPYGAAASCSPSSRQRREEGL
jgi:hypothetical protein